MARMKRLSAKFQEQTISQKDSMLHACQSQLRVAVLYVEADLGTCQRRVEQRAAEEGRPVQDQFVIDCHPQSQRSAEALREEVDLFIHVRNNVDGQDPVIVNEGGASQVKSFFIVFPVEEACHLHNLQTWLRHNRCWVTLLAPEAEAGARYARHA